MPERVELVAGKAEGSPAEPRAPVLTADDATGPLDLPIVRKAVVAVIAAITAMATRKAIRRFLLLAPSEFAEAVS